MPRQKPMRRPGAIVGLAIAMMAASCSAEPQAENGTEAAGPADAAANKAATSEARPPAQAMAARLTVEGEGLRWVLPSGGAGEAIPFGMRQDAFLASLEQVRGPAERRSNPDCPTGAVQYAAWPDGLSLVFEQGRFVGWGLSGGEGATGSVETASGIGPGDTRAQLDAQSAEVSQSTLGLEFAADEVYGLLDGPSPSARITEMWAGVSCHAT